MAVHGSDTTTVRVSKRAHAVITEIAEAHMSLKSRVVAAAVDRFAMLTIEQQSAAIRKVSSRRGKKPGGVSTPHQPPS